MYKLNKALYGLKQAPRAWYKRLSIFLLDNELTRGSVDTTLFTKHKNHDLLIIQIYVDDIIFGATNPSLCKEFAKLMQGEFKMSMMGKLNFILRFQIKQMKQGIFINQSMYIKEIVRKFGLENTEFFSTSMSSNGKLDNDKKGKSVDLKLYRAMIGSLLYLTTSRPDIIFSVCLCTRYQSNPKESHIKAIKKIIIYLNGT